MSIKNAYLKHHNKFLSQNINFGENKKSESNKHKYHKSQLPGNGNSVINKAFKKKLKGDFLNNTGNNFNKEYSKYLSST
jgi:hypothetical protein